MKSRHCTDSTDTSEQFHCHMKGHFPHPSNISVYLRCLDVGFKACICTCKYEHMCFDLKKNVCKFEYLDDLIDCSRPLAVSYNEAVSPIHKNLSLLVTYKRHDSDSAVTKKSDIDVNNDEENNSNIIVVNNKQHEDNQKVTLTPEHEANVVRERQSHDAKVVNAASSHLPDHLHEHTLVHNNPHGRPVWGHIQSSSLTARQVSMPFSLMKHDHSSFPTWAVALVVLCILILLVLIVLLMY